MANVDPAAAPRKPVYQVFEAEDGQLWFQYREQDPFPIMQAAFRLDTGTAWTSALQIKSNGAGNLDLPAPKLKA